MLPRVLLANRERSARLHERADPPEQTWVCNQSSWAGFHCARPPLGWGPGMGPACCPIPAWTLLRVKAEGWEGEGVL